MDLFPLEEMHLAPPAWWPNGTNGSWPKSLCNRPFAVPTPISDEYFCAPGFYCPLANSSIRDSIPQVCQPTMECQMTRLGFQFCDKQGVYEPILCPAKSFCPNSSLIHDCPEGHFCVVGQTEPTACEFFSHCPPSSETQLHFGGAVVALLIDVGLVLLFLAWRYGLSKHWLRRQKVRRSNRLFEAANRTGAPRQTAPHVPSKSSDYVDLSSAGEGLGTDLSASPSAAAAAWLLDTLLGPMPPVDHATAAQSAKDIAVAHGHPMLPRVRGRIASVNDGGGRDDLEEPEPRAAAAADDFGFGGKQSSGSGSFGSGAADSRRASLLAGEGEEEEEDAGASSDAELLLPPTSDCDTAADSPLRAAAKEVLVQGFEACNSGAALELSFDGVRWELPPPVNKVILHNVSGRIRPGRVTAIMGPSGAGKTSLMSVLLGKVDRTRGTIRINGKEDSTSSYKAALGFVPQDDTMIRELTVRENILYSARVRLPNTPEWTDERVQRHVDAVIEVLGLTHVADSVVGDETNRGVSGGQRKRCNIGIELAASPVCLFLDEPTSGLDSTAALEVCSVLKAIADLGLTVVAVVHQPRYDIFQSLDDLILLEPGGRVGYAGPRKASVRYFELLGFSMRDGNPADEMLDALAQKKLPVLEPQPLTREAFERPAGQAAAAAVADGSAGAGGEAVAPLNGAALSTRRRRHAVPLSVLWRQRGAEWRRLCLASGSLPQLGAAASASGVEVLAQSLRQRGASALRQMWLAHHRSLVQQARLVGALALELFVCVFAAVAMGASGTMVPELYQGMLVKPYTLISPAPMEFLLPIISLFVGLSAGVAGSPAGVKVFSEEKLIFYREASSGHSPFAYYIAKTVSMFYRLTLAALHFAGLYYMIARPAMPFSKFFAVSWADFFAVYGLAAFTSMLVRRENSALLAVVVAVILGSLGGSGPTLTQGRADGYYWLQAVSFARWSNEALYDAETLPYRGVMMVESLSAPFWGYTLNRFGYDLFVIVLLGVVYRVVAYVLLVTIDRAKQK